MVKHLGDSAKMQNEIPKIGTLGIGVTGRKVIPKLLRRKCGQTFQSESVE